MADYVEKDLLSSAQRRAVRKSLSGGNHDPNVVERILHRLSDPENSNQSHTKCDLLIRLLYCSKIGDDASIVACVNCLSDPDRNVKIKALEVLHAVVPIARAFDSRQQLIDALGKAVIDWNARIREMAVELLLTLLVDQRDKDTLSSVAFSLNDTETTEVPQYARVSSIETLSTMATKGDFTARKALKGDPRARRAVISGLYAADPVVRKTSIEALKSLSEKDDPQVFENVFHVLYDPHDDIRLAVLDLLQELTSVGNTLVVTHLCNYITSENRVKVAATKTLIAVAKRGDLDALRCLILGLDDKDPGVRSQSAQGLETTAIYGDQIPIYALLLKLNREKVKGILFLLDPQSLGKEHTSSRTVSTITDRDLPKLVVGRFLGEKTEATVNSPLSAASSPQNSLTAMKNFLLQQDSGKRRLEDAIGDNFVPLSRNTPERPKGRLPSDNLNLDSSLLADSSNQKLETIPFSLPSASSTKLGMIRSKIWERPITRGQTSRELKFRGTPASNKTHNRSPQSGKSSLSRTKSNLFSHLHHVTDRASSASNMDSDCSVRQAVIRALQQISPPGNVTVLDIIIERLSDNEELVRVTSLAALSKLCSPQAIANAANEADVKKGMELLLSLRIQLMRLLEDKNSKIKSAAMELLKAICGPGDVAVVTKIINCIQSLNQLDAVSALKYLVRNEKGNKLITRCILGCMNREYKAKQNSQDFRSLMESLVEMTVRGDRQTIVGLADIVRDSPNLSDKREWCIQLLHRIALRKDTALINGLMGDEAASPPDLLSEIERHRSALSNLALEVSVSVS